VKKRDSDVLVQLVNNSLSSMERIRDCREGY
jgi:hypothetical protein